MNQDLGREQRFAEAEAALEQYFTHVEAGAEFSFDDWCAQRPHIGAELRELYGVYSEIHSALERSRPSAQGPARGSSDPSARKAAGEDSLYCTELLARLVRGRRDFSNYHVGDCIAHGGMGEILLVRDDVLHRDLAMKVVRGRDSARPEAKPEVDPTRLARFLEEAQIMGQLDHPGIVPVHELGLDPGDRVYFTMKLVKGRTLKEIFDVVRRGSEEAWTRTRALGVIQRVCEAMAYAHDQGVVHRDLKPANVMVGRFGEVYVMDWGLARLTGKKNAHDPRSANREDTTDLHTERSARRNETPQSPMHTKDGDVIGTPAYMSPEQAQGKLDEVGPQSDVYAVGVMLYELLAGHTPYAESPRPRDPSALARQVLDGPPVPLHALARKAPSDLIAICEKAMARDWHARYRDMSELSADLTSFVEGRVVRAYESGAWAEACKWVQRNKALAAASAALLVLVIGGAIGISSAQAAGRKAAERERGIADAERLVADHVASFLVDLFDASDPLVAPRGDLTARELLDRARTKIRAALDEEPLVRARLLFAIGRSYRGLGDKAAAFELLGESLTLLRARLRSDDARTAEVLNMLGLIEPDLGLYEQGEQHLREGLAMSRRLGGPIDRQSVTLLLNLVKALRAHGKLDEAVECCDEVERCLRASGGMETQLGTLFLHNRAQLRRARGDLSGAETDYRLELSLLERFGAPDAFRWVATSNLAGVLWEARRLDEARALAEQALEGQRALLPPTNGDLLATIATLGLLAQSQQRYDEAERLMREVYTTRSQSSPPGARETLRAAQNLAALLVEVGRVDEAEPLLAQVLADQARLFEPDDDDHLAALVTQAILRHKQGRIEEALQLCEQALEGYGRSGVSPARLAQLWMQTAKLQRKLGHAEEAAQLVRRVLEDAPEGSGELDEAKQLLDEITSTRD